MVRMLTDLLELSRTLATMSAQHNETLSSYNSVDHASQIVELDAQKFRTAKAASELEIEGDRLEQELESLKGRLQELDMQGVEGDDLMKARREVDDPTMLVHKFGISDVTSLAIRANHQIQTQTEDLSITGHRYRG